MDVYEADGEVVHVLRHGLSSRGEVIGTVDWKRRHDHMQQHTGQHILSQALIQVCGIPTVGFAIGPDWSTVVLEQKPDELALESALDLANEVVNDDRPIEVLFPTQAELEDLPIRGVLPEKEEIRVIRVGGFDCSPCGGTHCKSTGAVRLIEMLGVRKEKDTHRLEFVCGRRADKISLRNARLVSQVATLLDVGPAEIVDRTRLLLDKSRAREEEINHLKEARLAMDYERLLTLATGADDGIVAAVLEDRTNQEVRQLAHMLVERPKIVVLLVGREAGKTGLAFARSPDRVEDMNEVLQRVCGITGCRGGGNPAFATGGGSGDVDAALVLDAARQALDAG